MPVSTVVTGIWEGLNRLELIGRTLDRLKQKRLNYNRYAKETISDALYDALVHASVKLKHIKGFGIIRLKAGYSQYKAPSDMIVPEALYFYKTASSSSELPRKTRSWLNINRPGWKTADGDPLLYYPGDDYGTLRKLGFYPTPSTDGDDYTLDPDTGIYVSATGMTTTGNITGTASATHATDMTDSGARTLADLGVLASMMIVNVTTGESGQIISVSGSTVVTDAADFTSGWTLGDSFAILAGEYGVVVSWEDDENYLFTGEIGGMADVASITGNVYVEYVRRPLKMASDDQYPQLPPELHQYLPDGAVWILKRNSPRGTSDFTEAAAAKAAFEEGLSGYTDLDETAEDDSCGVFYI